MFIVDWLSANWPEVFGAFTAGFAFAVAVAKLTPTKTDDEFLASLYAKLGPLLALLPLPKVTELAKAVAVADKAAAVAEKAAETAEAKAVAVEAAEAKAKA